jgi:predicted AAA+ superfamily ATPase
LEAAARESLAGRGERSLVLPFSLEEALGAEGDLATIVREERALGITKRMALYGGYPEVYLSADPEVVLGKLVEALVLRDASDRFRVRNVRMFRNVLALAASQVGNLCNYSEWAALTGCSNNAVQDYLQILEDTHVLRLVRPYVGGRRAEIIRAPKPFFLDNGVRNLLFGGFGALDQRPDQGALLESLVFTEIAKTIHPLLDSLHYWRTKSGAEVDFIVEHRGRILPVEVKRRAGKVTRSMRTFVKAYAPPLFLVVASRPEEDQQLNGCVVRTVPMHGVSGALRHWLG